MSESTDANTFSATDQLERELIWTALDEYRRVNPDHTEELSVLIERVSNTFEWVRES